MVKYNYSCQQSLKTQNYEMAELDCAIAQSVTKKFMEEECVSYYGKDADEMKIQLTLLLNNTNKIVKKLTRLIKH